MFSLLQIGVVEIAVFAVVCLVLAALSIRSRTARRWWLPVAIILAVSAICTPADPVSMLLVAGALLAAFAAGGLFSQNPSASAEKL